MSREPEPLNATAGHALASLLVRDLSEAARVRLPEPAHLERLLAELVSTAQRAWPGLALPAEVFVPYLARRIPVEEALGALSIRDQNLIRQHFLDGLTIDQLGKLYRVHRATAARWLQKATHRLMVRARAALTRRMRTSRSECDSLMRLVQSDFNLSLSRLLKKQRPKV